MDKVLTDFTPEKAMAALHENMIDKFSYLPTELDGMQVLHNDDICLVNSNLSTDMYNIVCDAKSSEPEVIKQAINYFQEQDLPFSWWIGFIHEPSNLTSQLEACGLAYVENELAMAVELATLPELADIEGFEIRAVNSPSEVEDLVSVFVELLPDEKQQQIEFFTQATPIITNPENKLHFSVGYLDGKPVATSSAHYHGGIVGVYDVITLPECRGRGIGKAMTLAALKSGIAKGYKIGALSASDEGQPVYRRLGFIDLKKLGVYGLES